MKHMEVNIKKLLYCGQALVSEGSGRRILVFHSFASGFGASCQEMRFPPWLPGDVDGLHWRCSPAWTQSTEIRKYKGHQRTKIYKLIKDIRSLPKPFPMAEPVGESLSFCFSTELGSPTIETPTLQSSGQFSAILKQILEVAICAGKLA